jgi:hypothetical protein
MSSDSTEESEIVFDPRKLKDDGNIQFRLKDYVGAHCIYLLAIALVPPPKMKEVNDFSPFYTVIVQRVLLL